ncbi:MAG TPA: hypothetical protein VMX94_00420 [Armatimonadota bacterium]|nr:hypothetical protein [Armatimonadota bacterium]
MRLFRESATRRPMGVLCISILIGPILGGLIVSAPAAAQIGAVSVAVVDFRNVSKVPNEMFATMATDAVAVELIRSGRFTPTPADALQAAMEGLGYKGKGDRVPKFLLTPDMMMRLGQKLGVNSVASGEVLSIKVNPDKKSAEVRMSVRILDVASGEWVNGAIATGASNPRIGYTADKDTDWIVEAINNAARKAVDTMVQYIIPEATIIGTVGTNEVLLNKGSQDGIEAGIEMIVFRRGEGGADEVVGRVRVSRVTSVDATASVIRSSRGVKPEDRVRAVYELPRDMGAAGTEAARTDRTKRIEKGSKLLWTVLLAFGLFALLKPGKDTPEQLGGAVAAAFMSPAEFGSLRHEGGILIAWNNPEGVRYADIIQYHVWRDNHSTYFSGGAASNFAGPVLAPDQTTALPISCALGSFDHHSIDDATDRVPISYVFPSNDHTAATAATVTSMPGITPGKSHNYWVSCVYRRQPAKSEEEGGRVTYWETTPVYAGRATYFLQRPRPLHPGDTSGAQYVSLDDVHFEWEGCRSGDVYVIEVSTSWEFKRDRTWVGKVYQPVSEDGTLCSRTFANVLNVSPELKDVQPGGMLYWRVGVRNSQDQPGPYPAGPSPGIEGEKNTRYIYSDPNEVLMFQMLGGVPPPPGG